MRYASHYRPDACVELMSPSQHQHAGEDPLRRKSEEWTQPFSEDCWSGCGSKLAPHMEVFTMLTKTEGDALGRTNVKKQNNYLMKVCRVAAEYASCLGCALG
jgi:hypothetical protein